MRGLLIRSMAGRLKEHANMHIHEGGRMGGMMPIPTGIETGNSLVTLDEVRRLMYYMLETSWGSSEAECPNLQGQRTRLRLRWPEN